MLFLEALNAHFLVGKYLSYYYIHLNLTKASVKKTFSILAMFNNFGLATPPLALSIADSMIASLMLDHPVTFSVCFLVFPRCLL